MNANTQRQRVAETAAKAALGAMKEEEAQTRLKSRPEASPAVSEEGDSAGTRHRGQIFRECGSG